MTAPPPFPEVPPAGPSLPQGPAYANPALALAAAPPPKRVNLRRAVLLGLLILFIAGCGLVVLGIIGYTGGLAALGVGAGAAILPVPLLVFCFLWLDRYEPEPTKYLAFCFAWGAFVATAVALLVNTFSAKLFHLPDALVAVVIAPLIEESMKAAGPVLLFFFRRRAFSGIIDGIVYCGLSATGFAMVENILYLGLKGYASAADKAGPVAGATALVAIFFARIIMTGFAHPLFTSMTGIGLGIAARASSRAVRIMAPIAGLLVAMMLHGSWNLMSVIATQSGYVLLYGYFAVMVPIFLGMVGFTLWLRSSEGRIVLRILPDYVHAGWLAPPEVAALGTLRRRLSARLWAKRVAGDAGVKAMRAFQFDATRLALLRDGMRRGINTGPSQAAATAQEEHALLGALSAYRRVFSGRDPQAPAAFWDGARYHVTFPDGVVRVVNPPPQPVVPVPVVLGPAVPPYPPPAYR
jgi:protease PrsW